MNVQNLKDNYPNLTHHMRKEGYSESYINGITNEIKRIIKFHQEKNGYLIRMSIAHMKNIALNLT